MQRDRSEPTTRLPEHAAGWAFFLDIDGTLIQFAERPDAVRVGDGLPRLLEALHAGTGGALALISGRTVADIDRLFAPLRFPAAGQHGVERRDATGRMHRHSFPADAIRDVAARLEEFAIAHPGLVLEDKGYSLALHYRLAPDLGGAVRSVLEREAAALGAEFEVQPGRLVYELKPGGRDKGKAIEEFMAEAPFLGRTPVFVGDDFTDEYGFETVNRVGGHSIKVGAGDSAARWRIADAQAVHDWLAQWAHRFAEAGPNLTGVQNS